MHFINLIINANAPRNHWGERGGQLPDVCGVSSALLVAAGAAPVAAALLAPRDAVAVSVGLSVGFPHALPGGRGRC